MSQSELVEHLQRLIKLQLVSSQDSNSLTTGISNVAIGSNSNFCGSCGGNSNYMKFSLNSETVTPQPNINIICITLDKLTAVTRRRYESQVCL